MKILGALIVLLITTSAIHAQTGTWHLVKAKTKAPNCSECGMASLDGKLYLIGGDGEGPKEVMSFDPIKAVWSKLAKAPVPMHHFQAVPYAGKIFVLEAFSGGGFPEQTTMTNVYSYDTKDNRWEKGGELPPGRRRAGAGAVEYKGQLYLVAGIQHGHSSGTTNMFDKYDPVTKAWTSLPDAPNIRDHCSATIINDKLYVVGGRNTSFRDPENKVPFFAKTMLDIDVFDFVTGTWSTLAAKLPLGTGGGALVNLNGTLYYMGGERATATEQNTPRKDVFYFNPAKDQQWQAGDTLTKARNGMAAAVLYNRIYVAGGSGGPGGPGAPGGPPPGNPNNFPNGHPQPGNMPPSPPGNQLPGQNSSIDLEVFTLNQQR